MRTSQKLLKLASSVALLAGTANGQLTSANFDFRANSTGNFRQSATGTNFEGGTFGITVSDGAYVWAGQPCELFVFFRGTGRCAPGSTGYISRGIENDPLLRGLGPYFTITSITPAQILKPFEPQKALLVAAPPSLLPRPLLGFEDQSLSMFYNLYDTSVRQYALTKYVYARGYTAVERSRFDGEVVPGTYRYNFSSLFSDILPQVIEVNQFPMLDGFRKVNNQPRGFRFLNLVFDADGFALLDPLLINTLRWEGNTFSFINAVQDRLELSVKQLINPLDPLSPPDLDAPTLFPEFFSTVAESRVILPSPLDTEFTLPPNFVRPGETGLLDLEFIISRPTTPIVGERATRRFRIPVRMINNFPSAMLASAPPGATAQQLSADGDLDGDGISNFTEWAFGTNPSQRDNAPFSPNVRMLSSDGPVLLDESGVTGTASALEYSFAKVKNPVPRLKYSIEYSGDMETWNAIKPGDPAWVLSDGIGEIKVTSSASNPQTGGFFRAKVELAN